MTPANTATVLAVLDVIEEEPARVQKVNQIAETMRNELKALGYNIGDSKTPIIPILIGDQIKTMQAWRFLFDTGIYTNVAIPPAVPPHLSLLRTSYMASHEQKHLDKILNAFKLMKDKLPGVTG